LLTIFTINLALKKTHHSLNHAMPWNLLHCIN
jgi:hypothetical protein